ncbi:MAG: sigma-54 dependent transcriptional regulator [Spirochaetaceae bacterium]|jgi:two-component system nitrogen regulation response regulator NtrX|nr:sigma-54 dependent transcriptional regulator [Spirochaetaceae bacterium]
MTRILIIDDELGIRKTLASILEDENYQTFTAEDAVAGIEILEKERINVILLDVLLPKLGGLEALERIRKEWPGIEVVVISGHANVDMAVRAVKLGAFDFLEKPLSLDKVLTVCRNAVTVQTLREENNGLKQIARRDDEIIGESQAIENVRILIRQAAAADARVLITGENGTGKELAARAIHRLSDRAAKPFVEVNCAAIPETLIESELFGHEKGAFTDAVSRRRGRFETASGGVIFLDEIGDMSLSAQAKVLRVIQEGKVERVGGEKILDVDVRIVAATNKDLEQECEEGKFRRDLFFRLNVIPIKLPALREREEDVPLLLMHFLKDMGAGHIELDRSAVDFLMSQPWPGNIRELKNLAERVVVMYGGDRLEAGDLQNLIQKNPGQKKAGTDEFFPASGQPDPQIQELNDMLNLNYTDAKNSFEKLYLKFQLARNNGVISRTAEAIGIYPSNLHAKLRKYKKD